jgi:hypothetical protein
MHTNKTSRIIFLVTLIVVACSLLFGNNDPTACLILCEA